jgi:hypothetical protein
VVVGTRADANDVTKAAMRTIVSDIRLLACCIFAVLFVMIVPLSVSRGVSTTHCTC